MGYLGWKTRLVFIWFKMPTNNILLVGIGSGGRIRTDDLRVMLATTAFAARRTGL